MVRNSSPFRRISASRWPRSGSTACGAADQLSESRVWRKRKGDPPKRIPLASNGLKRLLQVVRQMLVHLEHADPVFAPKDRLQRGVRHDFPFVLWVLQIVLADVIPDFGDHLAARARRASRTLRQIR